MGFCTKEIHLFTRFKREKTNLKLLGALLASQRLVALIPQGDTIAGTDSLEVFQNTRRTGNDSAGNPAKKQH